MKNLIFLLLVSFLTIGYSEPTRIDPIDIQFYGLYPEWFTYSENQKQDRRKIYELSENKWQWFPDLHPIPTTILNFNP